MNIIAIVGIYLLVQMSVVWVIYRILKNPSVVDASWSIGLMVAGLIYLFSSPSTPRLQIVSILLIFWALRLAGYLWYTRLYQGHVDKRYTELSTGWKISQSLGFFLNFQLQGLLIFSISLPFYLIIISNLPQLTAIDSVAILLIIAGIAGETTADLQLHQFKKQNSKGVCQTGLWYYSRHPNYFFDWITWFGFTLFALQSSKGYLALLSLLILYIVFNEITGPLTERGSVKSRGQLYINYQQQTSMFFPWFKKKIDSES